MIRSLRIWAFAIVAVVAVMVAETSQAVGESFLVAEEQQMHGLVNQARAERGLATLQSHDGLRIVARRQAQAMAAAGYIFHTTNLAAQADSVSLSWNLLGENVGTGPNVQMVQDAFMASPGHLANIVEPRYDALGVGATAGARGELYFSQNFADLRGGAPAAQPAPAAAPAPKPQVQAPAPAPAAPASTQQPSAPAPAPAPVPVATPAPTPVPTPQPSELLVQAAQDGAQGSHALQPSLASGQLEAGYSQDPDLEAVTLPRTLAGMLGRFIVQVTFWR